MLCGLLAARRDDGRWLVGAGALAMVAPLVKQSALDGAVAVVALLLLERRARWTAAAAVGAALPLAALELYEHWAHLPDGAMTYALLGFRLDALGRLAGTRGSFARSLGALALDAVGAGLPLLALAAPAGVRRLRRLGIAGAVPAAWLGAALVGVLAGGSYWPHYLIKLVAPLSVLAGAGLAEAPRLRRAVLVGVVAVNVTASGAALAVRDRTHPDAGKLAVAADVRALARPGDTAYVLWAGSDVLYYIGLPTPFPYAWSLMVRAQPGAPARLRALLASPRAPTWLIEQQRPDAWGLDPRGVLARTIARRYVRQAVVAGRPVYHLRGAGRRGRPA